MNDRQISDREIRAAFQARAEGTPSPHLAERIRAATQQTRQQRRLALIPGGLPRNTQRLLWAAVISATSLALVGGLLLAGRQNDDRTSVLPSPTPTASSEPSPSASAAPSGSPMPTPFEAAFSVDTFAAVVPGGSVPVSAEPGAPPEFLNQPGDFALQPDFPLVVVEGPMVVDGVEWYYFVSAGRVIDSLDGWAPIRDPGGNQWIVPTNVACLPSPMTTVQMNASGLGLDDGLPVCYGDTEITIVGQFSCTATSNPVVTGPTWYEPGGAHCSLDAYPGIRVYGTNTSWNEGVYAVTGHFDDPEAASCRWPESPSTRSTLSAVMYCRSLFIATDVRQGGLVVETAVQTIVDGIRVRSAPGVGTSSVKLEPLLPSATRLFVAAGSVAADGYDWYQVLPFDGALPQGWVARADRDGTPWVEGDMENCPEAPLDATALLSLGQFGGLACFGIGEVELIGDVHCESADVDRAISGPSWLRSDLYCELALGGGETMEIFAGGMTIGLPMSFRALVTGHFDDQQSASCVYALEPPAPDPASVVFDCRAMFVGTVMEGAT